MATSSVRIEVYLARGGQAIAARRSGTGDEQAQGGARQRGLDTSCTRASAFNGPKIDNTWLDSLGAPGRARDPVDFNLPERFDVNTR